MGIDEDFSKACYKALIAAGNKLPTEGGIYVTVNDQDKEKILAPVKALKEMGFTIYATWEPPPTSGDAESRQSPCSSSTRARSPTQSA